MSVQTPISPLPTTQILTSDQVIFPGYEPLDVYGPLEILYELSGLYPMTLSMVGPTLGPQSARPPLATADMIGPQTVATHTFDTAPPLDVIIVPGGGGLDKYEADNNTIIEDFLRARNESTSYILSVCTGAVTLAKAGLLKGKKATTNKAAFIYVADPKHGTGIEWVPSARWVANGHIWTSSGVAAGMDMMYAFLKHLYGEEGEANLGFVMDLIEYAPHTDPHWDPFSVVWKVSPISRSRNCV
jgi:putative intracellular protease/amidase